jgi:hypothetical protein
MEVHAEAFLEAFMALSYGLFYVVADRVSVAVDPHPISRG